MAPEELTKHNATIFDFDEIVVCCQRAEWWRSRFLIAADPDTAEPAIGRTLVEKVLNGSVYDYYPPPDVLDKPWLTQFTKTA